MHKYLISAENYQEILEAEKATKSKKSFKKLNILFWFVSAARTSRKRQNR